MSGTAWTDDEITALRRMWVEESMTSGQIARSLGKSRNSIMSKVHSQRLTRTTEIRRRNMVAGGRVSGQARAAKFAKPTAAPKPKALGGTTSGAMIANAARANSLFADHPPTRIWIITPRVSCPPGSYLAAGNKAGNGSSDWCWMVWDLTAPSSDTRIGWLRRGPASPEEAPR